MDSEQAGSCGVVNVIKTRRSIRAGYTDRPISHALLSTILECGLAAPSSKNSMPWRLHAVTSHQTLAEIASSMRAAPRLAQYVPHDPLTGQPRPEYRSTVLASADVLDDVPVAIVIENVAPFTRSMDALATAEGGRLQSALFGLALEMIGVGAALENMWLAAIDLGLQGCFLGDVGIAEGAIQRLLNCEGTILGALVLGYSAAPATPPMDAPAHADMLRVVHH